MIKKYFTSSFIITFLGILAGAYIGYFYEGSWKGALSMGFLTIVLGVLEVSLSFDNAIVNAAVLRHMTPIWRQRFLTWGILIAVFGMRLVFPLVIVSVLAEVSPWQALVLAATKPDDYAAIMLKSHLVLAGFGGTFLLMVAFKYFFDTHKDVHWIHTIEGPLTRLGKIEAISLAFAMIITYLISKKVPDPENHHFLVAGLFGVITFIFVDGLSSILESSGAGDTTGAVAKSSFGLFMYLEVLDASFSFDGVVGAFALTHNLFIIAVGLGIGAMFVRSLTIYLVDAGTLTHFRYLEHGAFYAIGALAIMMLLEGIMHIPEVVTGLLGAVIIGLSLYSSIRYNRKHAT